jgi:hypothetical protein
MYKNIPIIHEAQVLIHNELSEEFEDELKEIEAQAKTNQELNALNLIPDSTISVIKLLEKPEFEERIVDIVFR